MFRKLLIVALFLMLAGSLNSSFAFQSEKETSDFIAKNIQVKTDFSKTAIKISAIPKKVVVGGFNIRYLLYAPKVTFGGALSGANMVAAVAKAELFDKMKAQVLKFTPLIVASYQNHFKSSKIEIMPIGTASTSKSYQESQYKSEIVSRDMFDIEWEYSSFDTYWKMPAAGLKFIYGGDVPKKLFPALRKEAGADGVAWVNIALFRTGDDTLKLGDCIVEIYAPAKSDRDPDFLAFSVNLKTTNIYSKIDIKKDQWKDKDNKEGSSGISVGKSS